MKYLHAFLLHFFILFCLLSPTETYAQVDTIPTWLKKVKRVRLVDAPASPLDSNLLFNARCWNESTQKWEVCKVEYDSLQGKIRVGLVTFDTDQIIIGSKIFNKSISVWNEGQTDATTHDTWNLNVPISVKKSFAFNTTKERWINFGQRKGGLSIFEDSNGGVSMNYFIGKKSPDNPSYGGVSHTAYIDTTYLDKLNEHAKSIYNFMYGFQHQKPDGGYNWEYTETPDKFKNYHILRISPYYFGGHRALFGVSENETNVYNTLKVLDSKNVKTANTVFEVTQNDITASKAITLEDAFVLQPKSSFPTTNLKDGMITTYRSSETGTLQLYIYDATTTQWREIILQ